VGGMLEISQEVLLDLETRIAAGSSSAAQLEDWNHQAAFQRGLIAKLTRNRSGRRGEKIHELTASEEDQKRPTAAPPETTRQPDLF